MIGHLGIVLAVAGSLILAIGTALVSDAQLSKASRLTMDATRSPVYRFAIPARHDGRWGAVILAVGFFFQLVERWLSGVGADFWIAVLIGTSVVAVWWCLRGSSTKAATERFLEAIRRDG